MKDFRKIFNNIYNSHIDKIYRFIFLKVSSQEAAKDLTSETFLRFWERINNSQNSEIENPNAFLYQIAKNLVIDHYREKNQAQLVVSTENLNIEINDPKTDLEKKIVFNSDLKQMQEAMTRLKDEYQDVIIWYYLDDLSVSEIAEITPDIKCFLGNPHWGTVLGTVSYFA